MRLGAGAGFAAAAALSSPHMKFREISPVGAFSDLRLFLAGRQKHEWIFVVAAALCTAVILFGFVKDSHFEKTYKREIIYAESWPLNRSDEEIKKQQAIDLPKEQALKADYERRLEERRQEFKKIDDSLTNIGL